MKSTYLPTIKSDFTNSRRTICEVHREIYDEIKTIDGTQRAVELLEEAYGMGKKLAKKLIEYKYDHGKEAEKNYNYESSVELRLKDQQNEKLVIYTCVTGGKDQMYENQFISPKIDYVAFVDDEKVKSNTWNIVLIQGGSDPAKISKYFKFMPHRLPQISRYRISLWIDGRMKVAGDIYKAVKEELENRPIAFHTHPNPWLDDKNKRDLYDEAEICKNLKKDDPKIIDKQTQFYRQENHPRGFGIWSGGIIPRIHNNHYAVKIGEKMWKQILQFSCRDQIALPYVLWKINPPFDYSITSRKISDMIVKGVHRRKERLKQNG